MVRCGTQLTIASGHTRRRHEPRSSWEERLHVDAEMPHFRVPARDLPMLFGARIRHFHDEFPVWIKRFVV